MFHLLQKLLFFPKIGKQIDLFRKKGYKYLHAEEVTNNTPNDELTRSSQGYSFKPYNKSIKYPVTFFLYKYDNDTKIIKILTVSSSDCDCGCGYETDCLCPCTSYVTVYREVFINSLDDLKTLISKIFADEDFLSVYLLLDKEEPIFPCLIEDKTAHDRVYLKHSCGHDGLALTFNDIEQIIQVGIFESFCVNYDQVTYYDAVKKLANYIGLMYENFKPYDVASILNKETDEIITVSIEGNFIVYKVSTVETFRSLHGM